MPKNPDDPFGLGLRPIDDDDPFGLGLRPVESEPEKGLLDKWNELPINRPLWEAPARWGREFAESVDQGTLRNAATDENATDIGFGGNPYIRGFVGGAAEGVGNVISGLTTPLNLATAGAFKGASLLGTSAKALAEAGEVNKAFRAIAAARTATRAGKALSAPFFASGAAKIGSGLTDEEGIDWAKVGMGGAEAAGGILGMRASLPKIANARVKFPTVTSEPAPPNQRLLEGEIIEPSAPRTSPSTPPPPVEPTTPPGKTVSLENSAVDNNIIERMKSAGMRVSDVTPTHTIFTRILTEDEGTFDPQQMYANLKKLLGRDPTPEEVEQGMSRQVQEGETTGRVAGFPSRARFDELIAKSNGEGLTNGERTELAQLRRENPNYTLPELPPGQERITPTELQGPLSTQKPPRVRTETDSKGNTRVWINDKEYTGNFGPGGPTDAEIISLQRTIKDPESFKRLQELKAKQEGTELENITLVPPRGRGVEGDNVTSLSSSVSRMISLIPEPGIMMPHGSQRELFDLQNRILEQIESETNPQIAKKNLDELNTALSSSDLTSGQREHLEVLHAAADTTLNRGSKPTNVTNFPTEERQKFQEIANKDNVIMDGVRPQRGVPITHPEGSGGFVEHVRGNEYWVTHPMFPEPQGPFPNSDAVGDWIMQVQDSPEFDAHLQRHRESQSNVTNLPFKPRTITQGEPPDIPEVPLPEIPPELQVPYGPEADELNRLAELGLTRELTLDQKNRFRELQDKLFPDLAGEQDPFGDVANPFGEGNSPPPELQGPQLGDSLPDFPRDRFGNRIPGGRPTDPETLRDILGPKYDNINNIPGPDDPMWTDSPNYKPPYPSGNTQLTRPIPSQEQPNLFPMEMQTPEPSGDIAQLRARQLLGENWGAQGPEQLSMEGQMKDDEISAYLRGEDGTPPEMRDINMPPDDEPRFDRPQRPFKSDPYRSDLGPHFYGQGRFSISEDLANATASQYARARELGIDPTPFKGDSEALSIAIAKRRHELGLNQEEEGPTFARAQGGGLTASVNIKRAVENITRDYTSPLPGIMNREGMQNAMDAAEKLGANGVVKVRLNRKAKTIEIYDNGSGLDETGLSTKLVEIFATGKEGEEGATGGKGIGSASYIYGGDHFEVDSIAVDSTDGQKYRIIAGGTPDQFLDPVKGSDWERTLVPPDTPTGTTIKVKLKEEHSIADAARMLNNIIDNSRDRQSTVIADIDGETGDIPLKDVLPDEDDFATKHTFGKSEDDKLIGDFTTINRNSEIKVLIPEHVYQPQTEIKIHYLNNGMYQFTETEFLGADPVVVPERILVDIHPLVDDTDEMYPFINTREDIKKDIRDEISEFIAKNVSKPAIDKRKNRVQELYDSMSLVDVPGAVRKTVVFDPGNRMTENEMSKFVAHPIIQDLLAIYDAAIDDIIGSTGKTQWNERLEGVGLVLDPGMHGVHIPNPLTGKSTILLNPFIRIESESPKVAAWRGALTNLHEVAHIGNDYGTPIKLTPEDLADPRVGEFLAEYMNQLVQHGDTFVFHRTGHGMDFAHRLGEVYAKFGVRNTYELADAFHEVYTGGSESGEYRPEIQGLLQVYKQSRGRDATTEDLLSGTGVKQTNRRSGGTGGVSGNNQANRGRTAWSKVKGATGWGMGTSSSAPPPGPAGSRRMTTKEFLNEAMEIPSALTTTLDVSYPGRQGLYQILTPEFWTKALPSMGKSINPKAFDAIHAELRAKPIAAQTRNRRTGALEPSFLEREMGVKIFEPASTAPVTKRMENIASRWLETGGSIPFLSKAWRHTAGYPIRASNRMFLTMGNVLRVNRAEKLVQLMKDMSVKGLQTGRAPMPGILGGIHLSGGRNIGLTQKVTPQEAMELNPYYNLPLARDLGNFINTATGVAPQKTHLLPFKQAEFDMENPTNVLEHSAHALSKFLFSPGLFMSRIRMLNPSTYVMATPFARKQYMKAALSSAAAWFVFTEMLKMADPEAEIGNDPTSADFGKVRIGDWRGDLSGGTLPFMVAFARAYSGGATSSQTGEYHKFGEGYQAQTQEDMMQRFFVNKMKPVPKFIYDLAASTEHNPFHLGDRTMQLFIPLANQDLHEINKERPDLLGKLFAPIMLGAGSQVYDKGESVGKFIDPENDILIQGNEGLRSALPWNWGAEQGDKRNFPWSEPSD